MADRRVTVFMTGSTGYIGRRLAPELLRRGHTVTALARKASESKVASGCSVVLGNALDSSSYKEQTPKGCTFVHLVGVAHPSPAKAAQFRSIDLVSIQQAVEAARFAEASHFIYVSVAHPAPIMKEYIAVRTEGEALIKSSGLKATILRPWYVLGPGHWWPIALKPVYWVMEQIPGTRESAQRLGLVTLEQMVMTLANAVDRPAEGIRMVEAPAIKAGGL